MAQYQNDGTAVKHLRFLSAKAAQAADSSGTVVPLVGKGYRVTAKDAAASRGALTVGQLDPRTDIAKHRAMYGHLSARDAKTWTAYNRKETARFAEVLGNGGGFADLSQPDREMVQAESGYRVLKGLPNASISAVIAEVATRFDVKPDATPAPASTPKPTAKPKSTAPKGTVTPDKPADAQKARSIARKKVNA